MIETRRRSSVPTLEQRERIDLGIYLERQEGRPREIRVTIAANLNATNGTHLKRRIVDEIAAGATVFFFDLSRCERIDRRGQELHLSIANLAKRVGPFRITAIHPRALEALVVSELSHLFERAD